MMTGVGSTLNKIDISNYFPQFCKLGIFFFVIMNMDITGSLISDLLL